MNENEMTVVAAHSCGKSRFGMKIIEDRLREIANDKESKLIDGYLSLGFSKSKAKRWANRPQKRWLSFVKQGRKKSAEYKLRVLAASELVDGTNIRLISKLNETDLARKAEELYQSTNRAWRRSRVSPVLRQLRKAGK